MSLGLIVCGLVEFGLFGWLVGWLVGWLIRCCLGGLVAWWLEHGIFSVTASAILCSPLQFSKLGIFAK